MCVLRCTLRFERCANDFLQKGQVCGLSPVWILKCIARWFLRANSLSQLEHLKALSPMWISSICLIRSQSLENIWPQKRHALFSKKVCSCSIENAWMGVWLQFNKFHSVSFHPSLSVTRKAGNCWETVGRVVSDSYPSLTPWEASALGCGEIETSTSSSLTCWEHWAAFSSTLGSWSDCWDGKISPVSELQSKTIE